MGDKSMLAAVHAAASGDEAKPITAESLKTEAPDIYSAIFALGKAQGAADEMARIKGVEAQALPGHDALIASLKFDGKTTPEQAAVAVLAAEKQIAANRLESLKKDEAALKDLKSEYGSATGAVVEKKPGDGLEGEAKWKAEYAADAALQKEYLSEAHYLAFRKAESAGRVKVLRGKSSK